MMNTLDALKSRASTRAFLDKPVSDDIIRQILDAARWAPSGVNTQPWQVAVVRGETKEQITTGIIAAREAGQSPDPDYQYYPLEWKEPYKGRRKATGLALYSALGIGREDSEKQKQAWYNNYRFFGAPVGLLVFIDQELEQGSWMDLGMFVQSIMLAAVDLGLATCPQASLADYPDLIRQVLQLPESRLLACGLSLGYPDPTAAVNQYRTERLAIEEFCHWYD